MSSVPLSPSNQTKGFREDINGLRALAVVVVVLYHFGIPGFTGGFIGVDVFFVISGFLMTRIIITSMEKGNFSILSFYIARAKRILPALLFLCFILMILGWFFLPSIEYDNLAIHVISAIYFLSNIKFWREAGYFDVSSHEKWLLHTWSLSVEWQFYLLLPLFIVLFWRYFGAKGVAISLLVAGVCSLLLSSLLVNFSSSAAFYLLPTRGWEMLAGGGGWWFFRNYSIKPKLAKIIEILGLILIILSVLFFNSTMPWPGYYALVPVIGTVLILAAGRNESIFTTNFLAKKLGLSSYSIYLWHWPIVVALVYFGVQGNVFFILSGLLFSVLAGSLSYRFIETPSREFFSRRNNSSTFFSLVFLCFLVTVICVTLNVTDINGRISSAIEIASNESININSRRDECLIPANNGGASPKCIYGDGDVAVILIGDSHAEALVTALEMSYEGKGVMFIAKNACPTIFGAEHQPYQRRKGSCRKFNEDALVTTRNYSGKKIFIVNRTALYLHGQNEKARYESNGPWVYFPNKAQGKSFEEEFKEKLIETACKFNEQNDVFLVRPIPEMGVNVPKAITRAMTLGQLDPNISLTTDNYFHRENLVWEAQDEAIKRCGVRVLDPLPFLCASGKCIGSLNGRPLYYDDNHLSEFGNKVLVPMFDETHTKELSVLNY